MNKLEQSDYGYGQKPIFFQSMRHKKCSLLLLTYAWLRISPYILLLIFFVGCSSTNASIASGERILNINNVTLCCDNIRYTLSIDDNRICLKATSNTSIGIDQDCIGIRKSSLFQVIENNRQLIPISCALMENTATGATFRVVYESSLEAILQVRIAANTIVFKSKLINKGSKSRQIIVKFPMIESTGIGDIKDTYYVLVKEVTYLSKELITCEDLYGYQFPVQFIGIYNPKLNMGLYFMTKDLHAMHKSYHLRKTEANISMGVSYLNPTLAPNSTWCSPEVEIKAFSGDWRYPYNRYKQWVSTWHKPIAPPKEWFGTLFNLRQGNCYWHNRRIYDVATGQYDINNDIDWTSREFGGIDYYHFYDYMLTSNNIRTGDYDDFNHLGGKQQFKNAIRGIKAYNIPVGLYVEGYLAERVSKIGHDHGKEWQMWDEHGQKCWYTKEQIEYKLCPGHEGWREHLVNTCSRLINTFDVDAIYIDQFGKCNSNKLCYNPNHGHKVPSNPIINENRTMMELRSAFNHISKNIALYIEYPPCDLQTQYCDGSFSYNAKLTNNLMTENVAYNPSGIDLHRFLFPKFKRFELISNESPAGTCLSSDPFKCAFFNGKGYSVYSKDDVLCSAAAKFLWRRAYRILSTFKEVFNSADCEPLVPTLKSGIYANRFTYKGRTIFTIYNFSNEDYSGPILSLNTEKTCQFLDLWNWRQLPVKHVDGKTVISGTIKGKDVGCIGMFCQPLDEFQADQSAK